MLTLQRLGRGLARESSILDTPSFPLYSLRLLPSSLVMAVGGLSIIVALMPSALATALSL